jgi:hypothetical protein
MTKAMSVNVYVHASGPLFDGAAEQALAEMLDAIAKAGAQWAEDQLRQVRMDRTGRAHGDFQENLQLVKKNLGWSVPAPMIKGVVWGPWLEGVSSRNETTRFKGYRPFAQTRRALRAGKAQEIADEIAQEYIPQMGGE